MADANAQVLADRIAQFYQDINELLAPDIKVVFSSYLATYRALVTEAEALAKDKFPIVLDWGSEAVSHTDPAGAIGLKPLVGQLGVWFNAKMGLLGWNIAGQPKRWGRSSQG